MLSEITIKDFAIIEELSLQFNRGFNVLTGETGAGKSIILDAVSLLLGGRADSDQIRSGASKAVVEGVFVLDDSTAGNSIQAIVSREELEGDDSNILILTREVRRGGRNVCRVNGSTATLALFQEIGEDLIDIHGQSEHLSLLKPASHIELVDRYAGLEDERKAFGRLVEKVNGVRSELHDLITNEEKLQQRAEMLAYKVEEIDTAKLKPGEDEDLRDEAKRLSNAEELASLTQEAYQTIYGAQESQYSASDLLGEASGALARLVKIDPQAEELATIAEEISIRIEELGRGLGDYEQNIEFDPGRLQEAELRLNLIRSLKRKYNCETIEELIQAGQDAILELETIENSGERVAALQAEEAQLLAELGQAGVELSRKRASAAEELSKGVETGLADLKMENARFSVAIEQVEDPDGAVIGDYRVAFDKTGIDRVEFMIAPNLGEPLKPIARIASGGETSRIMLALKTVLSAADKMPTLIFDEIDSGIGGRIGAIVGQKLWMLAADHQVLVVTHLPQLAGFADAHFKVEKRVEKQRTITHVSGLKDEKRIDELTEMLGAEAESARSSAREILEYVARIKDQGAGV